MRYVAMNDSPAVPSSPADTFLGALDADTVVLLVFTMIIAWSLAQLALMLWKRIKRKNGASSKSTTTPDEHDDARRERVYKRTSQ